MDHKGKKGNNASTISTHVPVNALSLLHHSNVETFEQFQNRPVVKKHVYYPKVDARLHIPDVVSLIKYQKVDLFFRVFYKLQ